MALLDCEVNLGQVRAGALGEAGGGHPRGRGHCSAAGLFSPARVDGSPKAHGKPEESPIDFPSYGHLWVITGDNWGFTFYR